MTRCALRRRHRRLAPSLGVLLAACAGAPVGDDTAACPAPGPRAAPAMAFAIEGDAQRGLHLFQAQCAHCHAPRLRARAPDAPSSVPRLDCPAWLAEAGDAYLYEAINRGPAPFGHGNGTSLGVHLAPQDVADLVAWLRSLETR